MRKVEAEEAQPPEERRQLRLEDGGTKGHLSHRTKYATAFYEHQEDILEALAEAGVKTMPENDVAIT